MSRDDIHRIAILDPSKYRLIALLDSHEDEGSFEFVADDWNDGGEKGEQYEAMLNRLNGDHYVCRICGQNHGNRFWAYFEHDGTDVIQVGSKCAQKVGLADRKELEEVRAHESRKMARIRGHFLYGDPVRQRIINWAWSEVEGLELNPYGNKHLGAEGFPQEFAASLLAYFNREGYFSAKQEALALKLEAEKPEREAKERQLAEERAAEPDPSPVVEGKIEIVGKVIGLGTKEYPGRYGTDYRDVMTVLDDRGFKVWGTKPQALWGSKRGDRIRFTATVSVSDKDETFGFFKRPSKASLID